MKVFHFATIVLVFAIYFAAETETTTAFYVSKHGNNQDGLSWESAWNELDQIDWEQVQAGSVIYLDGGSSEMRYETELQIGNSGNEEAPIRIQTSTEAEHQGQVIFFGGRSEDLPYCGQSEFNDVPSAVTDHQS